MLRYSFLNFTNVYQIVNVFKIQISQLLGQSGNVKINYTYNSKSCQTCFNLLLIVKTNCKNNVAFRCMCTCTTCSYTVLIKVRSVLKVFHIFPVFVKM